jgi:hypothetical protein
MVELTDDDVVLHHVRQLSELPVKVPGAEDVAIDMPFRIPEEKRHAAVIAAKQIFGRRGNRYGFSGGRVRQTDSGLLSTSHCGMNPHSGMSPEPFVAPNI